MHQSLGRSSLHGFLLFFVLLIAVCLWAYWPALSGPFLFDDFANLNALSAFNDGFSVEAFKAFFMTGTAGPGGRPLSLLSFLIDDNAWPTTPWAFKYTNLLIHILNGCLLLMLQVRLAGRLYGGLTLGRLTLVFCITAFWLLNPYHVSAVMYVVQRMALLATTFVFFGLFLYVVGRERLEENRNFFGYLLIWSAYVVGAGLGTLCKENAVLFVLIAPLFEWLCFRGRGGRRPWLLLLTLFLPVLLFFLAITLRWPSLSEQYSFFRDFTLSERLLSEGRALGYYLWRYLVPGVGYTGIYADGFQKSINMVQPISTLFWLCVHVGIISVAFLAARKKPLFSLGVLFFYVSQILESTIVPLELFFEHRGYLSSSFLLIGVLHIKKVPRGGWVVALLMLLTCVILLHLRAGYWGNASVLKAIMMEQNPSSERARIDYVKNILRFNKIDEANKALAIYEENYPVGIEVAVNLVMLKCLSRQDSSYDVDLLKRSPEKYRAKTQTVVQGTIKLGENVVSGQCVTLTLNDLDGFLDNYLHAYPRDDQTIQGYHLAKSHLELYRNNYAGFLREAKKALSVWPNRGLVIGLCREVAKVGYQKDACSCYENNSSYFDPQNYSNSSFLRTLAGYDRELESQFERAKISTCENG